MRKGSWTGPGGRFTGSTLQALSEAALAALRSLAKPVIQRA